MMSAVAGVKNNTRWRPIAPAPEQDFGGAGAGFVQQVHVGLEPAVPEGGGARQQTVDFVV
jgi:hypothetical protein